MKNLNPVLLTLLLVLLNPGNYLSAQGVEYLDANNVKAGIGVGGNLFTVFDTAANASPQFRLFKGPKGSDKASVYTASLWLNGIDSTLRMHCAAQRYRELGQVFYDGPIVPNNGGPGTSNYNADYYRYYKKVFKITRAQVNHFQSQLLPLPGQIDTAILQWPAKGNAFVKFAYNVDIQSDLASFYDAKGDGIYNPLEGDYPYFCGDEAVFFVFNDDGRFKQTQSVEDNLGFEIRGLACVFADTTPAIQQYDKRAINNTVFVQYEIGNKSGGNYSNFYMGLFEDPDLGCFNNDRVGCDTARNLMLVYNGDTIDADCGIDSGYGKMPVAQGVKMLNQKMTAFSYFTNGSAPETRDPESCAQYVDYLSGFWSDGTQMTEGGTGWLSSGPPTSFMFPGDPSDPTQWSEEQVSQQLAPGDRRMLGGIRSMNFKSGETKQFNLAFFMSYDSTSNRLKIIDTLKRDADIIQQFYNNQIVTCRSAITGISEVSKEELSISVFPNPANRQITISASERFQYLQLSDMQGRIVQQQNVNVQQETINVSELSKGIYLLKIKGADKSAVKKIVVN